MVAHQGVGRSRSRVDRGLRFAAAHAPGPPRAAKRQPGRSANRLTAASSPLMVEVCSWDRRYRRPLAAHLKRDGEAGQPLSLGLAPSRGLPSRHLSMPLVRSYRTLAPLPVHLVGRTRPGPSAVCFCGTVLTVARTGRYPAGLAIGEPGLSSTESPACPKAIRPPIAITSPAFATSLKERLNGDPGRGPGWNNGFQLGCSSAG